MLTFLTVHIAFTVVRICSVVVGYQSFRGPHCLHLQDEVTLSQYYTPLQPSGP